MSQHSLWDAPEQDLQTAVHRLCAAYGHAAVEAAVIAEGPPRSVPSAPARNTDPETSHNAAHREPDLSRFSVRSQQARLLRAIADMPGGLTDQEAAIAVAGLTAPPSRLEGCRRRMSDLRAANYLMDSGYRRSNTGTLDASIVWRLTPAGRTALRALQMWGWSRRET